MADLTGKPFHILLVEDNEDHAELAIRAMRNLQLANTIHHVPDGEKALDYLFTRGEYSDPEKIPGQTSCSLTSGSPVLTGLMS